MKLEQLNVQRFQEQGAPLGVVLWPASFTAQISGTETMDELVEELVREIPKSSGKECGRLRRSGHGGVWPAFSGLYARIPYNNIAVDEEEGLAGFVLLNEMPVVGGRNIKEGIYGIRRHKTTLRGELLAYDSNGSRGQYFRHLVQTIDGGILRATIIGKRGQREVSYDLTTL